MSSSPSRPTRNRYRPYHDDPRWQAARHRLVSVQGLDDIADLARRAACDDMVLVEIEYGYPHG